MTPEWLHVGLTALLAVIGGFTIWQNTNIKLAISQSETRLEKQFSNIKEWARETFVSKSAQMSLLELVAHDKDKKAS